MTQLSLRLFGGFDATLDGVPVTAFDSNKVRALLAYLAVESGRAHRRESLAALLWPGYPDRSARTNLRNALANLRTAIGDRDAEPPFLLITRETLQFNRASDHRLDVAVLEDALSSAERVPTDQLAEAGDLHTGDFLAGFTLEDAVGFDDWASVTGERLRRQALELLGEVVDRLEAAGELDRALAYARRRVALEPWREAAQRQLIRLLAETGQRGAALRQYRECVRVLEEELEAEPSAETVALYEELRARTRVKASDTVEVSIASVASRPAMPRPPAFLDVAAEPLIADRPVFVGREPELARLAGYLDVALAGRGQVAFVVGGPGRGKSSLLRAFAEQAMAAHPDLLVVSGACNAYSGVGDAYLPFCEALEMLTGDVESRWRAGGVSRSHARRLWSWLPDILPALVAHSPHVIGSLVSGAGVVMRAEQAGLGAAPWMPELRTLSNRLAVSGLEQQALFRQVTNTLHAVALQRPLLLILDDLQWVDQGSIGLLFHLGRRLAGNRILILGAYRPEEVAAGRAPDGVSAPHSLTKILSEFRRDHGNVWIDLRRADESEGRVFVDALVDTEANRLEADFREALFERTGGHPLFTVELMRAMQARGALIRDEDGAWVEGEGLDWATLPVRVEAVIGERLGRLTEGQRDLLTVASVEGETFTAQVVARVQGLSERMVLRMLSQDLAGRHRLVREAEELPLNGGYCSRFAFAHALFQEYLYRELSGGERRLLHGEVAAALEDLHGEQPDQVVVQLAYHYDLAGNAEKATEYAILAGEQARLAFANDEARGWYQRALALLTASDMGEARLDWRLTALSELGELCFHTGEIGEAEELFREAIALGPAMELDPQQLVLIFHRLGEALKWQNRYEEQIRIGEEGLALLGDQPASLGTALMNHTVGDGAAQRGDFGRFRGMARETASFIRSLPYVPELRPAYRHIIEYCLGEPDLGVEAALEWIHDLEDKATRSGDLQALIDAARHRSIAFRSSGDYVAAGQILREHLEAAIRIGDIKEESFALLDLTRLMCVAGDLETAASYGHRALRLAEGLHLEFLNFWGHFHIGLIALARSDWQQARQEFRRADAFRVPEHFRLAGSSRCLAYLASGDSVHAKLCCENLLAEVGGEDDVALTKWLFCSTLGGLEEAYANPAGFRAWCMRYREDYPRVRVFLTQWFLESSSIQAGSDPLLVADDFTSLLPGWTWHDVFGDCAFTVGNGLEIRTANWRDMMYANLSAPRLLRPRPSDVTSAAVQVTCEPALVDRPTIGGLVLWKDKRDYLRLEVGRYGQRDVAFGGCLDNKDLIIGRGRLPEGVEPGWAMGESVTLRLELADDRVDAFCSLDGEQWYTVGHAAFPLDDAVQVGLHAIGLHTFSRSIHRGAYRQGTAIRFTSFRMWGTPETETTSMIRNGASGTPPGRGQEAQP